MIENAAFNGRNVIVVTGNNDWNMPQINTASTILDFDEGSPLREVLGISLTRNQVRELIEKYPKCIAALVMTNIDTRSFNRRRSREDAEELGAQLREVNRAAFIGLFSAMTNLDMKQWDSKGHPNIDGFYHRDLGTGRGYKSSYDISIEGASIEVATKIRRKLESLCSEEDSTHPQFARIASERAQESDPEQGGELAEYLQRLSRQHFRHIAKHPSRLPRTISSFLTEYFFY